VTGALVFCVVVRGGCFRVAIVNQFYGKPQLTGFLVRSTGFQLLELSVTIGISAFGALFCIVFDRLSTLKFSLAYLDGTLTFARGNSQSWSQKKDVPLLSLHQLKELI
jgi:hypothetical protein